MTHTLQSFRNKQTIMLSGIPVYDEARFTAFITDMLTEGHRLCAYFGTGTVSKTVHLYAVFADDRNGFLYCASCQAQTGHVPSCAVQFPQTHLFEREIYEQTGLVPDGHPWLKPVRFPQKAVLSGEHAPAIGEIDYFRMKGDQTHEVAVGPVHAGIIEPGHFRFQCHGETVYHLEISLGYQHRGIEASLSGGPCPLSPRLIEVIAGDTTIGHSYAYYQIIESLANTRVSPYANILRAIALELERCANHIGDLGALAGDIGFLPTMSYCGRIRGDFLNMTALLCGNRFGRGLLVHGGVGHELDETRRQELANKLRQGLADFLNATGLLWETPSVLERFETTGRLSKKTAQSIGLVGPAARASGCMCDVRQDHASGQYRFAQIPVSSFDTGDVFARAHVRWQEVQASIAFIQKLLAELKNVSRTRQPAAPVPADGALAPEALVVSLVEGWRGEICHVALTDAQGRFSRYKIIDPSFHNWFGLALALRNQQISDFPLCNKSFNLSYCGFDL